MSLSFRFLYGGSFNLEAKNTNYILNMLIIADLIQLTSLIEILQNYLVGRRRNQLNEQFSLIHKTCTKHQNFKELQIYCDSTSQITPNVIFKADDFITLDRDVLIFVLEN